MEVENITIKDIDKSLLKDNYVSNNEISFFNSSEL